MREGARSRRLPLGQRIALSARIWRYFLIVRFHLPREPLPRLVNRLGPLAFARARRIPPDQLGRYVARWLSVGPFHTTCLVNALVLYRLLRDQGDRAELVIGLPADAAGPAAHAWIELDGRDVGPPPGASGHMAVGRFS